MSAPLTPETLRALLDAAGLPGAGPVWSDAEGLWVRMDDTGDWFISDSEHSRRSIRDRLSGWRGNAAARHDSAARVLGAPDLATARGLAAENAAIHAEVARLRAQRDAFRAALTEPAGWPGIDQLREAVRPPDCAVQEVRDDIACRAGMVLDALAAALAAMEAP